MKKNTKSDRKLRKLRFENLEERQLLSATDLAALEIAAEEGNSPLVATENADVDVIDISEVSNASVERNSHDLNVVKALGIDPDDSSSVEWNSNGRFYRINVRVYNLTKVDLSGCSGLTYVTLSGQNPVTTLDLTDCTSLERLTVKNNSNLTTIKGLTTCTNLGDANIESCPKLSQLDFKMVEGKYKGSLKITDCSSLSRIDVTGSDNLGTFGIHNNPSLSSITGLVNCKSLYSLSISESSIMQLDVTGCTALTALYLKDLPKLSSLKGYCGTPGIRDTEILNCGLSTLDFSGAVGSFNPISVDLNVKEIYIPEKISGRSQIEVWTYAEESSYQIVDKNGNKIIKYRNQDYSASLIDFGPTDFRYSDGTSVYPNDSSAWSLATPITFTAYSEDKAVIGSVTIRTGKPTTTKLPTPTASATSTTSSIALNWTSSATSFEVQYKKSSSTTWSTPVTVPGKSYTFTGLTADTSYDVRVRAKGNGSTTEDSAYKTLTISTKPTSTPSTQWPTPSATASTLANAITLNWTSSATSFEVQYKKSSSSTWSTAKTVAGKSYTFANLTPSTTYNVRVRALGDGSNTTSEYKTLTVTTRAAGDLVKAPIPTASATSTANTIALSWTSSATSFLVQYKETSSSTWSTAKTVTGKSYTFTSLTSNTSYDVRVRALGNGSTTANSAYKTLTVSTKATSTPWPTPSVTTSTFTNAIELKWTSSATSFEVQYKKSSSSTWSTAKTVTGKSYTFTGLTASTSYDVRVRALGDGSHTTSGYKTLTVTTLAEGALPKLPVPTASATSTANTIALSWTSSATSFLVSYKEASASSFSTAQTVTGKSYTFTGLKPNTEYIVRVKAKGDGVATSNSDYRSVTITTKAGASPLATPTASATSTTSSIALNWTSSATSFLVQYKETSASSFSTAQTVTGKSYTFTGLKPNTEYIVRVKAKGDGVATSNSDYCSVTIATKAGASPLATPTASATSTTSSIALSWTSSATSFEVQYKKSSSSTWSTATKVTGKSYTFTGLTSGTSYDVRVRALGNGSTTANSAYKTLTVSTKATSTKLATPSATTSTLTNAIALNWTSSATSFEVQYKKSSSSTWSTAKTVAGKSYTFANLTPSTTYNVRVRALGDGSTTTNSDYKTLTVTTRETGDLVKAPIPTASASTTGKTITLVWTSNADSFLVQYKEASSSSWSTAKTVTGKSYTFEDLKPNTEYNVRVKAKGDNIATKNSDYCEVTATTTAAKLPIPVASATATSSTITLSWTSSATSFYVQYKEASASSYSTALKVTGKSYKFTGLKPNTQYNVRVKAIGDGVNNANSDYRMVTVTTKSTVSAAFLDYDADDVFALFDELN